MAFRGRDFLLKIEDAANPGVFTTVGGMRSNDFSINDETVDITSKDTNGFREYLAGAGLRSVSASGDGVFRNDDMIKQINTLVMAGDHARWQIIVPDMGVYEGLFAISTFSLSGTFNGELTFNISLESAAEVSFTPN